MARSRRDVDEERRRIFRRMEWVYVYAPPLLALFVAALCAAFVAWAVRVEGTTFVGRWALGVLLFLGIPGLVYLIKSRFDQDD